MLSKLKRAPQCQHLHCLGRDGEGVVHLVAALGAVAGGTVGFLKGLPIYSREKIRSFISAQGYFRGTK